MKRRIETKTVRDARAKLGKDLLKLMHEHHVYMSHLHKWNGVDEKNALNDLNDVVNEITRKMRAYYKINKAKITKDKEALLIDLFDLYHVIYKSPSIIENAAGNAASAWNYVIRIRGTNKKLPDKEKNSIAFSQRIEHIYLIPHEVMINLIKHLYKKKYKVELKFA